MIRVLRIMEYVYADNESAEQDMARWNIPASGARRTSIQGYIRSAIITDLDWPMRNEISTKPVNSYIPESYEPEYTDPRRDVVAQCTICRLGTNGYCEHFIPRRIDSYDLLAYDKRTRLPLGPIYVLPSCSICKFGPKDDCEHFTSRADVNPKAELDRARDKLLETDMNIMKDPTDTSWLETD